MSNEITPRVVALHFARGGKRVPRRGAKLQGGGQLTVTPSKLVFLRASRKSFSHNASLYRKSDIVWLRWKCRILRATCFTASATVQIPSYVYPWNLEYSVPRLELYSIRYWSGVWGKRKRIKSIGQRDATGVCILAYGRNSKRHVAVVVVVAYPRQFRLSRALNRSGLRLNAIFGKARIRSDALSIYVNPRIRAPCIRYITLHLQIFPAIRSRFSYRKLPDIYHIQLVISKEGERALRRYFRKRGTQS